MNKEIVKWIKSLPQGTTIYWADESLSEAKPFVFPWVDVVIPALGEFLKEEFTLTFQAPGSKHEDAIELPYNAAFVVEFEDEIPERAFLEIENGPDFELPSLIGNVRSLWKIYWSNLLDNQEESSSVPVWTPEFISRAIEEWIEDLSGRNDLIVLWNPQLKVDEVDVSFGESGHENSYQIGEGIFASEKVFDELLAMDPDEAAEIVKQLKALSNQLGEE